MKKIIALVLILLAGVMVTRSKAQSNAHVSVQFAAPTPTGTLTPVPGGYPQWTSPGDPLNSAAWTGYLASLGLNAQGTPYTATPTGSPTPTVTSTPTADNIQSQTFFPVTNSGVTFICPSVNGVTKTFYQLGVEAILNAGSTGLTLNGYNFIGSPVTNTQNAYPLTIAAGTVTVYAAYAQSNSFGVAMGPANGCYWRVQTASVPSPTETALTLTLNICFGYNLAENNDEPFHQFFKGAPADMFFDKYAFHDKKPDKFPFMIVHNYNAQSDFWRAYHESIREWLYG